jgi:hypothetical protein
VSGCGEPPGGRAGDRCGRQPAGWVGGAGDGWGRQPVG